MKTAKPDRESVFLCLIPGIPAAIRRCDNFFQCGFQMVESNVSSDGRTSSETLPKQDPYEETVGAWRAFLSPCDQVLHEFAACSVVNPHVGHFVLGLPSVAEGSPADSEFERRRLDSKFSYRNKNEDC